ncbi:hypothetical protein EMPS_08948 [Entomortierella parvispora]|uniref:SET domain-containing protein n=1 Tax=Entomortierella parvispora TaxID=205924 RepID=A0A9P3HH20_9FUNG|nr:hypothetical protein EMPS_08948 [Entomortierella parvispora]
MSHRDPLRVPPSHADNSSTNDGSSSRSNNLDHQRHQRHQRAKGFPSQSEEAFPDLSPLKAQLQATVADSEPRTPTIVSSPKFLPPDWPAHVKYLVDYEYHPSISESTLDLVLGRRRKHTECHPKKAEQGMRRDVADIGFLEKEADDNEEKGESALRVTDGRTQEEQDYDEIPMGHAIPGLEFTANSTTVTAKGERSADEELYEIRYIDTPDHPVCGSYGLFALKTLRPGLHLLDYISLVVPDEFADPDSDHTLYLCNDLNLDASVHGNHGRFVNDFRGIRTQEQGPNVGWDLYRDADTGQVRMGCKVLKRIRKGEEILCTYGHDYWKSRGVKVEGEEWEEGWDTDLDDVESSSSSDDSDGSDHEAEVKDEAIEEEDFEDTFRPPRLPTPDRE